MLYLVILGRAGLHQKVHMQREATAQASCANVRQPPAVGRCQTLGPNQVLEQSNTWLRVGVGTRCLTVRHTSARQGSTEAFGEAREAHRGQRLKKIPGLRAYEMVEWRACSVPRPAARACAAAVQRRRWSCLTAPGEGVGTVLTAPGGGVGQLVQHLLEEVLEKSNTSKRRCWNRVF